MPGITYVAPNPRAQLSPAETARLAHFSSYDDFSLITHVKAWDTDIVKLMLKAGYDTELETSRGRTALFWAVRGDKFDIVKCLVDAGAVVSPFILKYARDHHRLGVVRHYVSRDTMRNLEGPPRVRVNLRKLRVLFWASRLMFWWYSAVHRPGLAASREAALLFENDMEEL